MVFHSLRNIQLKRQLREEQGFTLIELLIVIVVLGILAAVVVFALGNVTGQSAQAACTSDAKTVSIAISAEQTQTPNVVPTAPTATVDSNLVPTYLKSWPSNSNFYGIGLSSDGLAVTVTLNGNDPGNASTLLDGQATQPLPAELYESDPTTPTATAAFAFNAGDPTSLAGLGICAGA